MRVVAHIGNRLKLYVEYRELAYTCFRPAQSMQGAHLVRGSELSKSETGLFFPQVLLKKSIHDRRHCSPRV